MNPPSSAASSQSITAAIVIATSFMMAAAAAPPQLARDDRVALLPPIDLAEPFERIRAAIDEAQRHG